MKAIVYIFILLATVLPPLTAQSEAISRYPFLSDSVQSEHLGNRDSLSLHSNINNPRSFLIKRPMFISTSYMGGMVVKSNDALRETTTRNFSSTQYGEIKMGFTSEGNRWKDIVYGMPYYGIGVGVYDFATYNNLGNPISIYLLQGATLKAFSPSLRLNYEWNFGTSFNWDPYDPLTNPTNQSISAKANIYFAANLFLTKAVSKYVDLEFGLAVNHVSNGSTKVPNSGINSVGVHVGMKYHFDRERVLNEWNPQLHAPVYENARLISDFTFHSTVRQRNLDTLQTGLSTKYIDKSFFVMNMAYALMHMPNYKYRYGMGVDLVYDESSGMTARKIGVDGNGIDIAEVHKGSWYKRFAIGVSARGDIVMPKYTVFGQFGVNLIRGNSMNPRFYQAFGVKVPFWGNLYGSFSIRARSFSKAEYGFLGVGYMFDHKPFRRRGKGFS